MISRRYARELIVQGLYQLEMSHLPKEEILNFILNKIDTGKETEENVREIIDFISTNFLGSVENLKFIDKLIIDKSKNWHFGRINKVDKSLLRSAIYEVFFRDDIPDSVVINEAIEIAKKYSTGDSSKFINGILGAIVRDEKKKTQ